MSVLLALISRRDGLIATDGRQFAPAQYEGDRRVQDAEPETDCFNKTFSLLDGKVVGGFVGLVKFSGKTVADHVRDILLSRCPRPTGLEQIAGVVGPELAQRLEQIVEGEVLQQHRIVDVVFVGGRDLRRANFLIIPLCFRPSASGNGITWEKQAAVSYQKSRELWPLFRGDGAATARGQEFLAATTSRSTNREHLGSLARQTLAMAIARAGVHPHGTQESCGGEIFVELTYY